MQYRKTALRLIAVTTLLALPVLANAQDFRVAYAGSMGTVMDLH